MIIWAWGAIESDFLNYYNIDLNNVHKNNLITFRKFLLLVRELPEHSAFQRWLRDKDNRNFVVNSDIDIDNSIQRMKVR